MGSIILMIMIHMRLFGRLLYVWAFMILGYLAFMMQFFDGGNRGVKQHQRAWLWQTLVFLTLEFQPKN